MDESILNSIKKLLGISEEDSHFNTDIIVHINSVFMVLNQIGIGPEECFAIEDESESWTDFLQDKKQFEAVKSYTYLKVKLLFDPPLSSAVMDSMNRMINEYEWRLNIMAEENLKKEEAQNG